MGSTAVGCRRDTVYINQQLKAEDVAAQPVGYWLVAEVWLDEGGQVETVNNLGEGLPLDNAAWP